MAKATKIPITPVYEYTLTLTEAEARTVIAAMAAASGDPNYSPRKHCDAIRGALQKATGVDYADTEEWKLLKSGKGPSDYKYQLCWWPNYEAH